MLYRVCTSWVHVMWHFELNCAMAGALWTPVAHYSVSYYNSTTFTLKITVCTCCYCIMYDLILKLYRLLEYTPYTQIYSSLLSQVIINYHKKLDWTYTQTFKREKNEYWKLKFGHLYVQVKILKFWNWKRMFSMAENHIIFFVLPENARRTLP